MRAAELQWSRLAVSVLVSGCCLVVGGLSAQTVRVVSGEDAVVVDGDFVRIRSGSGDVVVDPSWRRSGRPLSTSEAERVMIDLAAVEADGRLQINLAGDVLFAFDSSRLDAPAAAQLERVGQVIRGKSVGEVHVIGHTDGKGSSAHNLELSRERALAVMRWLQAQAGIPFGVMVGSGVGARYPVAPEKLPNGADDPAGRARNRRVEVQMATRDGVRLGPGLVTVAPGRITTPEAVIDAHGVTTGDVRVEIGAAGVTVHDRGAAPTAAPRTSGAASCARLCEATAGRHAAGTIACFEGQFEELGYDLDEDACDGLENAMVLGTGNEGGRACSQCQGEAGFTDAHCAVVLGACFRQPR